MMVSEVPATIRARLLGPVEIIAGGRLLTSRDWSGRKAKSLLLLLLATRDHRLHREQVLDVLWPDLDLDAGANALYKALHALRRTLEPGLRTGRDSRYIDARGDTIGLHHDLPLALDVDRFDALLTQAASAEPEEACRLLAHALDLWRGEFVADETGQDWPIARREALAADRERATHRLARLSRDGDSPLVAVPYLNALLAGHPAPDATRRDLMQAYAAVGQRGNALREFERYREQCAREGREPEAATLALGNALREAGDPAPIDPERVIAASRYRSLPTVPTPTIGRQAETAAVSGHLAGGGLVSILGPGGIGKTRLAIEVAAAAKDAFPDGAGFVPLAAITDPRFFFEAIGQALGLPERPDLPARTAVTNHLEGKAYLLVLDNLEQLAGLGPDLAALLAACPGLTVLATSRSPLNVPDERIYRLDPLALPKAGEDAGNLADVDSVALFVQHAQAMRFGYAPDAGELDAIAGICVQLDGLPLAIELAAARTADLSPAEILALLEQRSRADVIRDGPQDLPERQQTLRNLVLWSYDLLAGPEQVLFRRLAVFAGVIELDALGAVGGDDATLLAGALAEKSLLQWQEIDGTRHLVMLETIREVARGLLDERGEIGAAQGARARFYVDLAMSHRPPLPAQQTSLWWSRLQRDLPNIRAVLDWLTRPANDDPVAPLVLMSCTSAFWFFRRHVREGLGWFRQVLAMNPGVVSRDTANVAYQVAHLSEYVGDEQAFTEFEAVARAQFAVTGQPEGIFANAWMSTLRLQNEGRHEETIAINEEALPGLRGIGDTADMINSLGAIANSQLALGRIDDAVATLDTALDLARERGDLVAQSALLLNLGETVLEEGDLDGAAAHAAAAERLALRIDNKILASSIANLNSVVAFEQGEHDRALRLAQEASRLYAEAGDGRGVAMTTLAIGAIHVDRGDVASASDALDRALGLVDRYGAAEDVANAALEVGLLALALGQAETACTLLGAFKAQFEANGWEPSASQSRRHANGVAAARMAAGEKADTAIGRGGQLEPAVILALARDTCGGAAPGLAEAIA